MEMTLPEGIFGLMLLIILLGGIPCMFVIVMLAAGVSKKKLSLMVGVPAAALLVYALILLAMWDGIMGEVGPAWLIALMGVPTCFGPPMALIGLVALYRKLRSKRSEQG